MLTGRRDFECEAIIWSRQGPVKESHAIIRTILKDLPPSALGDGAILFHEHLSFGADFFERMRPANAPRPATPPPPSYLTRPEIVAEELRAAGKEGLRWIVDGGHADMGTSYEDQGSVVAVVTPIGRPRVSGLRMTRQTNHIRFRDLASAGPARQTCSAFFWRF